MLDLYVYYYESDCEDVAPTFIENLLQICKEHVDFALKDPQSQAEGAKAASHLKNTSEYMKKMKQSDDAGLAAKFAELTVS
jgi:hypothetical protein